MSVDDRVVEYADGTVVDHATNNVLVDGEGATRNRVCDHHWRHAGHIGPGTERSICLKCGFVLVET